jgi:hypothetical protein
MRGKPPSTAGVADRHRKCDQVFEGDGRKNFSLVGPRKRRFWRRRRFTRDDSQDFHHYERKRSNPEHKFFARLDCFVALWAPRNDDSMII